MLVPAQAIESKKFATTRLREGYDPDEVDAFLDEVAGTVAELNAHIDRLLLEVERLKQATPSAGAQKLLEVAQRTADEMEGEAGHKAGLILSEATAKAQSIEAEARRTADTVVAGADARRDELTRQADKLTDYRDRAVRAMETALNALKEGQS